MDKVSLALLIHAHQPVGNFEHVLEEAYQKSYAPFLTVLAAHPQIRLSLHFSGILLEWLEKRHAEYFDRLRELSERGQVELVGGGFYEPILPVVPDWDKHAQLRKLADFLRARFGVEPRGAWIAERVWEPGLARPLAEAGVEYVVLDDTHFLAAGLESHELHDSYITEEQGHPLRLVPSLKRLRYTIPFREPEETLRVLREGTDQPPALFAMGDDCEKFGVWPGTYQHCYTNGWLEKFLRALEEASDWLETTPVGDYLAHHPPRGRIYLPTASYAEMTEWALPPSVAREFKACMEESERSPSAARFHRFLRGGLWRNFLSRYAESNQLQKFMLMVSQRCQAARAAVQPGTEPARLLEEAREHILAAQCNDAYWHGIFGGLYAPHLRSALFRHVIQAETILDRLSDRGDSKIRLIGRDFDVDGQAETILDHPSFAMVIRPADGGTVSSLRFKAADAELINSLMRRPEAYHEAVRQQAQSPQPSSARPASIHERMLSKEANLAALLRYDRYGRHAFRTYVFPSSKRWEDFEGLRLDENGDLAAGGWNATLRPGTTGVVELQREALHRVLGEDVRLKAVKTLSTRLVDSAWRVECRQSLSLDSVRDAPLALGLELVFNLLAPDAPDRYFLARGVRRPLEFRGEIEAPRLELVDEWQRVRIRLEADPTPRWWVAPIETISQSESGYERVYQGSAILAVWKIEPPSWREITCTLRAEIGRPGALSET